VQVAHMRMSFGLSWYSASCFDIFSRAFAGAVVARTKLTMLAIMPQTSLRRPTPIEPLAHGLLPILISVGFPLDAPTSRVFCTRSNRATPMTMFGCYTLTRWSMRSIALTDPYSMSL
jgi:hypothetical protein